MKRQSIKIFFAFSLVIAGHISCNQRDKDDYEQLLKDTPIRKEFATNSPVTKDVTFQLLSEANKFGNFRMTADLKGQLSDQYLAYEVDDKKIVLRDDGKGADSVKGDGLFSVFVSIDTNEVKEMITEQNASVSRSAAAEENIRDVRNVIEFLKFDNRDSSRALASHALLRNDPNFTFENRQVKFEKRIPPATEISAASWIRKPVHIFPAFLCPAPPADLIPKSLMINNLGVVEDVTRTWNPVTHTGNKNGAWTFNNIINQMANKAVTGISATKFVLQWLQTWDNDVSFNGDVAGKRVNIDNLINTWKQRSLAHGLPAETLDMAEAPVKLLAIVNRLDLRENVGYSSTNAGEGRFVFCVLKANANTVTNSPELFTIIFEYGINKKGCTSVVFWGQQWYNLHNQTPGTPVYNAALQKITDQFVNANTSPSKPNGCSLNQIRSDERSLASIWQLREFNIDANSHLLKLVSVKKTPQNSLNNSATLATFINANCAGIASSNYQIPQPSGAGGNPVGIKSDNKDVLPDAWNAAITCTNPSLIRQVFSINTCNGCHGVETQHFPPTSGNDFTHVRPASFGSMATLSGFLSGETVTDPVSHAPETFADLDDRAKKLQSLVCSACRLIAPIAFRPLNMVH